jgi:ABC-type transport system involved in multi-copper enzyme maturation permease subunit
MSASTTLGPVEGVLVIAGRELGNYVDSKIAYVYTVAFVVLANSIFMNEFFLTGTVDMTGFFDLMPLLLPVFLPAVTMRLWAEERKQRTIEMLLTMPIRPAQAVLGKYLAAMALFALFLAGSLPIVIMLMALGDPDPGLIVSGYLGVLLFGSLLLALGTFLSALSSDQIVAFVTTTVAGFLFVLSGDDRVVAVLDGLFPGVEVGTRMYESFSTAPHYDAFVRGVVGLPAAVYFVGLSALFLWICSTVLERHRA